jgi:hypothetical protein
MLRFNQFRLSGYLAAWVLAMFSLSLAGCAQDLERINQTLHAINTGAPLPSQTAVAPGQSVEASVETQKQPTQLILPNDKSVTTAMDAAMPVIKKVISLNRCMKNEDSLRLLNFYAVPGKSFQLHWNYPNSKNYLKYHDFNNCIAARTMDQWSMPALNALRFRVVYFAEDSGETVNFQYEFKRVDDGTWKLDSIRPRVS